MLRKSAEIRGRRIDLKEMIHLKEEFLELAKSEAFRSLVEPETLAMMQQRIDEDYEEALRQDSEDRANSKFKNRQNIRVYNLQSPELYRL